MRTFGFVAVVVCGAALGSCSPYTYKEPIGAFSGKVAEANASDKASLQSEIIEEHTLKRVMWLNERPLLKLGPGCTPSRTANVACMIESSLEPAKPMRRGGTGVGRATAPPEPSAGGTDACTAVGAPQLRQPETGREAAERLAPLQREEVFKALARYLDGLAAVTNAEDRAAFDAAASKVAAAVGSLAGTAAAASPGGPAIGPLAQAATNLVLWVVGEALDQRRYEMLREGTRLACSPVRVLSKALQFILEEQREHRLQLLSATLTWRVTALDDRRSTLSDTAYTAAVDDLFRTLDQYEAVRNVDPENMSKAIADTHDKLVLAVHRNDGQFVQVIDALEQLNNQIDALVSAAHSANGKNTAK